MSFLKKGNSEFVKGNYKEASAFYRKARESDPGLTKLIDFNLALCERRLTLRPDKITALVPMTSSPATVASECKSTELYPKDHPAAPYLMSHQIYSVDIVIPVYNALEDVKLCLKSVSQNRGLYRGQTYLVNDASDKETTDYLRWFCAENEGFHLIEHEKNCGYTKTVNDGLRASTADFVITLNSDTIVTKGWLQSLVRCIRSDEKIGIVGPLSNAASWQNVPNLLDKNGQFAINDLPDGWVADDMSKLVLELSSRSYPRVPFINGFCFMIAREVIETIGYLDEDSFPTGYGEENDYCIRALDAGYQLAIADDGYVFHSKSKSFGHEKRKKLSKHGSEQLKLKHGEKKFKDLVDKIKKNGQLERLRADIRKRIEVSNKLAKDTGGLASLSSAKRPKILFLLPVQGGGGGAHSVVQEADAIQSMGFTVHVGMRHEQVDKFLSDYEDMPSASKMFIGFSEDDVINFSETYDIVIATLFSSVKLLRRIVSVHKHIMPAYYIQDYEPLFFYPGSDKWVEAKESYELIGENFCFAKTQWIIDKVWDEHGVPVQKVSPSVDHNVYNVSSRNPKPGKVVVSAMIRPKTPRRGAMRTMNLLSRLKEEFGGNLEIKIFGCDDSDLTDYGLPTDFSYVNYGVLKRNQVATVLRESDIFIDLSDYQAFGRTGIEAMACGCASLLPVYGGAHEYVVNGVNGLFVDPFDMDATLKAVRDLVCDSKMLSSMQDEALLTAAKYSVNRAAMSELAPLIKRWTCHKQDNPAIERKDVLVFPSLQKDGVTPTGSGYVRLVLPYQSDTFLRRHRVQVIKKLPGRSGGEGSVIVMQRDVPTVKLGELRSWVSDWQSNGNFIVYDLDDDLLELGALSTRGNFSEESVAKVKYLLQASDVITVSTASLRTKVAADNRIVEVIPNGLDERIWNLNSKRDHSKGPFARSPDSFITIGYIGTESHVEDVQLLQYVIPKLEKKYGEKIRVEVVGVFQNQPATFGERVGLPKKNDYPNFVNWLEQRVHWDIGLIPLSHNEFNRSKSYLKFLEYGALDMAVVVSEHPAYSSIAVHQENCLVSVNSVDGWEESISNLIDDAGLRVKLSSSARRMVSEQHGLKKIGERLNSLFSSAIEYSVTSGL